MVICLAFQMDFLFFRERERAHLVIRLWAEIATSGSLAPHSTCPLSHAAPASWWIQWPGLHKWEPSGGLPPHGSFRKWGVGVGVPPAFHLPSASFPGTWLCS